ncbi:hypothetical protein R1flu_017609 [Riccia fluitans]|uniref:Uncharacterized protein n=1 Tax=Riccia fluitans TaxID=41844 RepID=A0ABD1ZES3_9MARC
MVLPEKRIHLILARGILVYLQIPNHEISLVSRKLPDITDLPLLLCRSSMLWIGARLFFPSHVVASPSELWGMEILRIVDLHWRTDFSSLQVMRSPSELWEMGVGDVGLRVMDPVLRTAFFLPL